MYKFYYFKWPWCKIRRRNVKGAFRLFESKVSFVQLSSAPSSIAGLFAHLADVDRGALLLGHLAAFLLRHLATLFTGDILALLLRNLRT